jgi:hypothetical protein
MAEETKPDFVDTGLTFKGYPVLLGARKVSPQLADILILTSLDRYLFISCQSIYEGYCSLHSRKTMVEGVMPWPDGKGPRSLSERADERAKAFVQKCLDEAKAKRKWCQFWKESE